MSLELKNWKGDELKKLVKLEYSKRLEAAAILLKNDIKESISEPSNHGRTPSEPGEPPHKESGRLRASISHEMNEDKSVARVGTNVLYGKFLELGTRFMESRPFIRAAFDRNVSKLKQIIRGK